ncbi:glucose-6-phosphate exchanger SLC37A2 isoform X2 [Anoplophora glabripennis]|uniref:glucose-6-phosphate exchanger SLC37A2 isoform X2 n=1 Tax=Anoplophora glabripennis TaxID=217634 RepID=UPI000874E366|nr:glucose-6-phosphate exchanger SLC37A2 isoform X2 [Anoplophora glabripennis]
MFCDVFYIFRYFRRKIKMSLMYNEVPLGVRILQKLTDKCCPRFHFNREICYRASVAFLTYIAYMCYHLSRKPISVVKTVLHRNCSGLSLPSTSSPPDHWCDWAPFNGTDANAAQMLGELDSAFLFSYAAAMFLSGFIADRVNLRYFLSLGMIMSGIFCYLFGLAKTYNIHHFSYYIVVQALAGIFQTTGWPGVVSVMSNWFGKEKRGLIFGLWNSHTSIGNILGSLIAAEYVEVDWALSFVMPGLYIGVAGFVIYLFLVVNPSDVGCVVADNRRSCLKRERLLENQVANNSSSGEVSSGISSDVDDSEILIGEQEVQRRITERTHLLPRSSPERNEQAIGFFNACCIPGVVEFSLALFFSKLVGYTFLYWLPLYVNASTTMGATLSADMSTLYDVGGIAGAIIAGVVSDKTDMPAITCSVMLVLTAPMLVVYQKLSTVNLGLNMILLVIVGLLVNGPYALITTAVAAELGTHHSLEGNSKALATVAAIIDGTGSIGAAIGPLLAGFVSGYGWESVFLMLMISDILAFILLLRLAKHEFVKYRNARRAGIRIE